MARCAYAADGRSCTRDALGLSRFCSVHAERGAPESVVTPGSGPRESGIRRLDEAALLPKTDDKVLL